VGLASTISPTVVELERQELEWLLTSGLLGRSQNLVRMLTFICENTSMAGPIASMHPPSRSKHSGAAQISFFQNYTIFRVTARALRKRFFEVYQI
jgi:hypothetical protein